MPEDNYIFMSQLHKSLSRQYLILGTAIALLTACSQQPVKEAQNLNASPTDTTTTSPPSTSTSVGEKPSVSQQEDKTTTSDKTLTSPSSTKKTVNQKPVVSQQKDKATPASQTEVRSCGAGDVQAVLDDYQGGAGSRYGHINFTNTAKTPCVLQGRPQIELLNSGGQSLSVKETALQSDKVGAKVIVQPQQHAYLAFRWSNWCLKEPNNEIKFVVNLPGSQEKVPVSLPNETKYAPPPCNGPDQPSSLSVRAFSSTPSP